MPNWYELNNCNVQNQQCIDGCSLKSKNNVIRVKHCRNCESTRQIFWTSAFGNSKIFKNCAFLFKMKIHALKEWKHTAFLPDGLVWGAKMNSTFVSARMEFILNNWKSSFRRTCKVLLINSVSSTGFPAGSNVRLIRWVGSP